MRVKQSDVKWMLKLPEMGTTLNGAINRLLAKIEVNEASDEEILADTVVLVNEVAKYWGHDDMAKVAPTKSLIRLLALLT